MNAKRLLVSLVLALSILGQTVLTAFADGEGPATPTPAPQPDEPTCSLGVSQNFNHVDFTVSWGNGNESGVYSFQFDDGSSHDLGGAGGSESFSHDYGYSVGGKTAYNPGVVIDGPGGSARCGEKIVIDDTPIPTPVIPESSCSLNLVSQSLNVITLATSVEATGDYPGHLEWGDGSGLDLPSGTQSFEHGYGYKEGGVANYTITLSVAEKENPCTLDIAIDDSPAPQEPPEPNPLPDDQGNGNSEGNKVLTPKEPYKALQTHTLGEVSPNGAYRVVSASGMLSIDMPDGSSYPTGVEGENPIWLADWSILAQHTDGSLFLTDRFATFTRELGVSGQVVSVSLDGEWLKIAGETSLIVSIHGMRYGLGNVDSPLFTQIAFPGT